MTSGLDSQRCALNLAKKSLVFIDTFGFEWLSTVKKVYHKVFLSMELLSIRRYSTGLFCNVPVTIDKKIVLDPLLMRDG
jgi:hypothetical protein